MSLQNKIWHFRGHLELWRISLEFIQAVRDILPLCKSLLHQTPRVSYITSWLKLRIFQKGYDKERRVKWIYPKIEQFFLATPTWKFLLVKMWISRCNCYWNSVDFIPLLYITNTRLHTQPRRCLDSSAISVKLFRDLSNIIKLHTHFHTKKLYINNINIKWIPLSSFQTRIQKNCTIKSHYSVLW